MEKTKPWLLELGTKAENNALAAITARASGCPSIRKIAVFGSRVRGDFTSDSDLDILVVVDDIMTREAVIKLLYAIETEFDVPLSPVLYTEREVEINRKMGSGFMKNVDREGIVLYDTAGKSEKVRG